MTDYTHPVTLKSGQVVHITPDDLRDLVIDRADEVLVDAMKARSRHRASIVDVVAEFGLVEATQHEWLSMVNPPVVYTLPEAYGQIPYGVPMLAYWPSDREVFRFDGDDNDYWSLSLSRDPLNAVAVAGWDDVDGIRRLAQGLLDNTAETLYMQVVLQEPRLDPVGFTVRNVFPRAASGRYLHEEVEDLTDSLFALAETLPAITTDMLQVFTDLGIGVSPVHVLDPRLCRWVAFPGMAVLSTPAHQRGTARLAMKTAGLSTVPHSVMYADRGDRHITYVTTRGFGARIGRLPRAVWHAARPENTALFGDRYDFWKVLSTEPLTLEERAAVHAERRASV